MAATSRAHPVTITVGAHATFKPSGDGGLVVEFGTRIDRLVSAQVMRTAQAVEKANISGVRELVPTFRSLFVHYDPLRARFSELSKAIAELQLGHVEAPSIGRVAEIPVRYGGKAGDDLGSVAEAAGLSSDEVVALHSGTTYFVYMLGFLPGYAYLGDVPEPIRLPRRPTPRVRVPPGSVAIANEMACVYSLESPGGWHLIGHTPVKFFDAAADEPTLLSPGDGVRFVPVSEADHAEIASACQSGRYRVQITGCE